MYLLKVTIILLVLFSNTSYLFAQDFEGIISYQITYKDTILIEGGICYRTNAPIAQEYKFKANYLKDTYVREDVEKNTTAMFDYVDNKEYHWGWGLRTKGLVAIDITIPNLEVFEQVRELGETEEIAGFSCQKYEITDNIYGEVVKHYVWTTKEINLESYRGQISFLGTFYWARLPKSLGFPLKLSFERRDVENVKSTITLTANKAEKIILDTKDFQIPSYLKHKYLQGGD